MGETSDPMNRSEERRSADGRTGMTDAANDTPTEIDVVEISALEEDDEDDTDASDTGGASESTDAIRHDIEQTRAQMSGTIDEIQERLSPTRLMNEAKETVRDATVGKVTGMMNNAGRSAEGFVDRIREHPVSAAMIGVGAWWLLNKLPASSSGSSYNRRYGNFSTDRYPTGSYGSNEQYGWSREGGDARGVRDMAHDASETISDYTSRGQQRIGEMAHDATEAISDYTWRGQQRISDMADRAESQFNRWMRENPLAVGAAAIAVGAAIGMAIPETDRERELIGETRDRLVDKAQEMASHTVEQVASALPGGNSGASNSGSGASAASRSATGAQGSSGSGSGSSQSGGSRSAGSESGKTGA